MRVVVAALFAVFAAAMIFIPAESALAQTSPRDCASENRIADPDGDTSQCGRCADGRLWDGTNCVTESNGFDVANFANHCAAAGGNKGLDEDGITSEVYDRTVGAGDRNLVAHICWKPGGTSGQCYLVVDPDVDPATQILYANDGGQWHGAGNTFTRCLDVAAYAPCTPPAEKETTGNPFSACVAEVACPDEGTYDDSGTCRCSAGYEPDGSGGCDACTGGRISEATTADEDGVCACPKFFELDVDGENCVSNCPLGQQTKPGSDPSQCEVCPPGTYNPGVGFDCVSCANGTTGDVMNGGATSCACDANFKKNDDGECEGIVQRTVQISLAVDGTLSAKWSGDDDLRDGETVPTGTRVTFIATPDAGYFVSLWIGCPSTTANTGDSRDGREKECATTADADLSVAATFGDLNECFTNNGICLNGAACENSVGSFRCKCAAGFGGDLCGSALPKAEMTVPAGATLHATPEEDCYVQGWTAGACATPETGSSGETGSAGRKSCVASGTGKVTVGVYFECGP